MEKLKDSSHHPEVSSKGTLCLHIYSYYVPRVSPLSFEEPLENQQLRGVLSCNCGVKLSHLLFKDDNLLFCETTTAECRNLIDILESYKRASGQAINRQKTTLYFSPNTSQRVKLDIQNMLGP